MLTVHVNPLGIEDEYLKCLNLCFDNWGNQHKFYWYFQRKTSYPDADLIILKKDDELVAGSGVSYRRVAFPNDREVCVGIMTGSWTLPRFRGEGCFTRIIEESVRLAAQKHCALLLAFVRQENASFQQLAKAGAALFPSFYLRSIPQTPRQRGDSKIISLGKSQEVIRKMFERLKECGQGYSRFVYSSEDDFSSQFIHRPCETEILSDDKGNFGIIEKNGETDILQMCLPALDDEAGFTNSLAGFLARSLESGRKLFLFSSLGAVERAGRELGLEVKPGCLTVLPAQETLLRNALELSSPLTIPTSKQLVEFNLPWSLGSWNVHGGDRT